MLMLSRAQYRDKPSSIRVDSNEIVGKQLNPHPFQRLWFTFIRHHTAIGSLMETERQTPVICNPGRWAGRTVQADDEVEAVSRWVSIWRNGMAVIRGGMSREAFRDKSYTNTAPVPLLNKTRLPT